MKKTIRSLWDKAESSFTTAPAVRWLDKGSIAEKSYGKLGEKITAVRKGILAEGFSGKHIALLGVSSVEWVEAYFGSITGKNTVIPIDAALAHEDIIDLLNRSNTEALFIDPKFAALVEPIKKSCPNVKQFWTLAGEAAEGTESIEDLCKAGEGGADSEGPEEDDVAMIIYTSGTTGKSKGVMLLQKNLYTNVEALSIGPKPGVVFMSVLPVHHAYCLVMDWLQGFQMGAVICINDSLMHLVKNLSVFKPHVMLMVPLMLETIYKRMRVAASKMSPEEVREKVFGGRLKRVYTGGAHLDPFYIDEFAKYGVLVLEGYGMSECSPVISTNTEGCYKAGSIGKPLPNVEIKFENGEILVRSTSVMTGYYNMDKETEEALKDGWLHTGDKGYMDEDGFLYINGRVKNLIILSNGENISPEEIETKISLAPIVSEVVITGENNALTARIFPEAEIASKMTEEELREALQKVLDDYNKDQPTYRQLVKLVIRKNPFIKTSTRKTIRDKVELDVEKA